MFLVNYGFTVYYGFACEFWIYVYFTLSFVYGVLVACLYACLFLG